MIDGQQGILSVKMTMASAAVSCHQSCRTSMFPPWLDTALAEIEQRVQLLAVESAESKPDSFAERAENYYEKRPHLLSLLRDLYHSYRYLADRYSQSSLKSQHARELEEIAEDNYAKAGESEGSLAFDDESTVSFQSSAGEASTKAADVVVAELAGAMVERDLAVHELGEVEQRWREAARKAELQGSLLEVLESERLVLLGENARLGLAAAAAEAEARGLAAELAYVRRRAGELARCVVKVREGHRACLLNQRIEGLLAKIHALERHNRECYDAMVGREAEKREAKAEIDSLRAENRRLNDAAAAAERRRRVVSRWWGRVASMEWALCGKQGE